MASLAAVVVVLAMSPAVSHAVSFDWSGPLAVPGTGPGLAFSALTCPSASQCTAVDGAGMEVTFDPASPGTPTPTAVDGTSQLTAMACPSVSQCTAVDQAGSEVTFDPATPAAAATTRVDATSPLTGWRARRRANARSSTPAARWRPSTRPRPGRPP